MKKEWVLIILTFALFGCGGGGGSSSIPPASNSSGGGIGTPVSQGNIVSAPSVSTGSVVWDIVATSARATGNISSDGGVPVTSRKICWSKSADYSAAKCVGNAAGIGEFSEMLTGLMPDTVYYVWAFAENSVGKTYGNRVEFRTGSARVKVNDGTNTYVVIERSDDAFLAKFDQAENQVWEKPALATPGIIDECPNAAVMSGSIYLLCVQDDPQLPHMNTGKIFFEKISASDGQKATEAVLQNYGAPMYLASDSATGLLYGGYSTARDGSFLALIGIDGIILATAFTSLSYPNPDGSGGTINEALYDAIVVGGDGVYAVGTIMLDGARSRIYVVKFSKDLTTRIWTAQYRNFADSIWLDSSTSAKLSADGTKLIIEGDLDVLSANPRKVLLEFNTATGALISAQ